MKVPSFLLRTPVPVEPRIGNTGDGETFGPAVTVRAYVERGKRTVRDQLGREHKCDVMLVVRPDAAVQLGDRITIDGDSRVVRVRNRQGDGPRDAMIELYAG